MAYSTHTHIFFSLDQQNPASLQESWLIEDRDLAVRLAQATVPVFYSHAYFDTVSGPLSALGHLESMPASVRSMLSTLGHGVPLNALERAANLGGRDDGYRRWRR